MSFELRVQKSNLGSLCFEKGVDSSFLAPGEVETRGSTHLDGKPLPQCKPSASRRDATPEEKEKLRPETLCASYLKVTCRILCKILDFYVYLS